MPETAFTHRTTTPAAPARVWARLQDPATWATVAGVDRTTDEVHEGGDLRSFRFSTSIGRARYRGDARVTNARFHQEMTLSIRSNELTGEIVVRIEPAPEATGLDVEMRMRPNGVLGSVVFPLVTGAVAGSFEDSVERLARIMA